MNPLDALDPRFRLILCDIWGVIHDGGRLLPGAAERLSRFKAEGRKVVLITNAPRPADRVRRHLDVLCLPAEAYDAVTSSGEAGIAALARSSRPVGFLGTAADRSDLQAHGVEIAAEGFAEVAVTGLDDWRDDLGDYEGELLEWAERGVRMHCLNPDRVVLHRGSRLACAGALADRYEAMGGQVRWYGKPYGPIYDHALSLAGSPPREEVLAIGDGLATDMLGAARYGIDAVFVSHGIHEGEPVPADFAARHGLGDWHPILTVPGLA